MQLLPWAGYPVLPVSIADVNYLSCKMAFMRANWNSSGDCLNLRPINLIVVMYYFQ